MTTLAHPEPMYWDPIPRAARLTLGDKEAILLSVLEGLRRRLGRDSFEATDQDIAQAAGRSVWFVARYLPRLRGTWVSWDVVRGRRVLTMLYHLPKGEEAPKREANFSAQAPRHLGATAKRSRRNCQEVSALAPMLPFKEERDRASERSESAEERPESAAEAATGRDVLAPLPGGGVEPPVPDLSAAIAEARGAIAELERTDRRSRMLPLWRSMLARLESGDASALTLADRDPEVPRATPSPPGRPAPPPPTTGPPRAAPPPGLSLDEAIRLCRLGPAAADSFAAYYAAFIGEADNPITLAFLRDVATHLRPEWVAPILRSNAKPRTVHAGKRLSSILGPVLDQKLAANRAATSRP